MIPASAGAAASNVSAKATDHAFLDIVILPFAFVSYDKSHYFETVSNSVTTSSRGIAAFALFSFSSSAKTFGQTPFQA